MWGGDSVDMVSPLALVRVVIFIFSLLFSISSVILMEQLQIFLVALLKLRYSSTPFSKKLPSWPVPDLSCKYPVVGSCPGPSFHFRDRDPVGERPAKRFRITGKSSAVTRAQVSFRDLPTPKR